MAIAVVGELVIGRRQPLQTLRCDRRKVAGELRVLGQYHRAACDEAVDKRFLPMAHAGVDDLRFALFWKIPTPKSWLVIQFLYWYSLLRFGC